ncbi:hypothetical protein FRC06_004178, partial [Ceratobasidium sp. 370]
MKMTNFKPQDWERFKETPADREIKAKLEEALNITLPEWSMVVWGPRAMLYDPTPKMFEEQGNELVELLMNELTTWSVREARNNPLFKRILDGKDSCIELALETYLTRRKLNNSIKQQNPPEAE